MTRLLLQIFIAFSCLMVFVGTPGAAAHAATAYIQSACNAEYSECYNGSTANDIPDACTNTSYAYITVALGSTYPGWSPIFSQLLWDEYRSDASEFTGWIFADPDKVDSLAGTPTVVPSTSYPANIEEYNKDDIFFDDSVGFNTVIWSGHGSCRPVNDDPAHPATRDDVMVICDRSNFGGAAANPQLYFTGVRSDLEIGERGYQGKSGSGETNYFINDGSCSVDLRTLANIWANPQEESVPGVHAFVGTDGGFYDQANNSLACDTETSSCLCDGNKCLSDALDSDSKLLDLFNEMLYGATPLADAWLFTADTIGEDMTKGAAAVVAVRGPCYGTDSYFERFAKENPWYRNFADPPLDSCMGITYSTGGEPWVRY